MRTGTIDLETEIERTGVKKREAEVTGVQAEIEMAAEIEMVEGTETMEETGMEEEGTGPDHARRPVMRRANRRNCHSTRNHPLDRSRIEEIHWTRCQKPPRSGWRGEIEEKSHLDSAAQGSTECEIQCREMRLSELHPVEWAVSRGAPIHWTGCL
jgi:hypothetical protein